MSACHRAWSDESGRAPQEVGAEEAKQKAQSHASEAAHSEEGGPAGRCQRKTRKAPREH